MCTVSVIPIGRARLRVGFSRDELRTRPAGLPPRAQTFGGRRAILPLDGSGGGTWLAVNDAGLILFLLNYNPQPADVLPPGPRSRGRIIPSLLHHESAQSAADAAGELHTTDYGPFRVVMFDPTSYRQLVWDGQRLLQISLPFQREAMLFTSSGLGDALVQRPRCELFDEMITPGGRTAGRQDEFHAHRWPDRPQLSVCMDRPEARTVSYTTVEISPVRAAMTYFPNWPDPRGRSTESLPLCGPRPLRVAS